MYELQTESTLRLICRLTVALVKQSFRVLFMLMLVTNVVKRACALKKSSLFILPHMGVQCAPVTGQYEHVWDMSSIDVFGNYRTKCISDLCASSCAIILNIIQANLSVHETSHFDIISLVSKIVSMCPGLP